MQNIPIVADIYNQFPRMFTGHTVENQQYMPTIAYIHVTILRALQWHHLMRNNITEFIEDQLMQCPMQMYVWYSFCHLICPFFYLSDTTTLAAAFTTTIPEYTFVFFSPRAVQKLNVVSEDLVHNMNSQQGPDVSVAQVCVSASRGFFQHFFFVSSESTHTISHNRNITLAHLHNMYYI